MTALLWLVVATPPTVILSILVAYRVGILHAERTFKRMYGCLYCGAYQVLEPEGCSDTHCVGHADYDEYAESQLKHPRGRIRGLINQLLSRYRFN